MKKINMSNARTVVTCVKTETVSWQDEQNKIIDYYGKLDASKLVLPNHSSMRQYRLWVGDRFVIVKKRIKRPEQLLKHLINKPVLGVYASIGVWLNPTTLRRIVRNKKLIESKIRMNPMLMSDYVIDIDTEFISHKDDTIKCYYLLTHLGFGPLRIIFSGKGSQIIISDFFKSDERDPVKRMLDCKQKFKRMTDMLMKYNFGLDFKVMMDWPTRVVKHIPNTLSSHGTIVEELKIEDVADFEPTRIFGPIKQEKGGMRLVSTKLHYRNRTELIKYE